MRILYAIQGTGNGHIARAMDVIPQLREHGQVDLLVSGCQADLSLPWPVKYRLHGLSFVFGKKGGVDARETLKRMRLGQLMQEIWHLPVHTYDVVISDFEPVSAWACLWRGVRCIGLSHQSAVLHQAAPRPMQFDWFGKSVLRFYAPVSYFFGFHFQPLDKHIFTPVIRKDIRTATSTQGAHYTVYLPSWSDQRILDFIAAANSGGQWEVFSKHCRSPYRVGEVLIHPVHQQKFTESFLNCKGILCNAGFEAPAEALYLKKKLCVVPMRGQYEQQCNAAMLEQMGVTVLQGNGASDVEKFRNWLEQSHVVEVDYPNQTPAVIDQLMASVFESEDALLSAASF